MREDSFGYVGARGGEFFCEVGYAVAGVVVSKLTSTVVGLGLWDGIDLRCPHSKSPIQHPSAKHKPIALPSRLVLPVFPHKLVTRISLSASTGHDSAYHDGDENTNEDEEETDVRQFGQRAIGEHDDEAGEPGNDEIDDEDVPALKGIAGVEEAVHGNDLVGEDGGDGGGAEDPT